MASPHPQPIDLKLLEQTSLKAQHSDRKRINHNFHDYEDAIQRFLNAIEPESYIRPHRHAEPMRDEIFLVLKGSGAVLIFDRDGTITAIHLLELSLGFWGIDIPGGTYHTIISREKGSVFYEIKQGPFNPEAPKGFAPWAPVEGTEEADTYLQHLQQAVSQFKESLK